MKPTSLRVVLVRHGPAGRRDDERWPDDRLRPLSPRGVERTRVAAGGLARIERGPAVIWTSRLTRAIQSARILRDALDGEVALEELDALAPEGPLEAVVERMRSLTGEARLFVVGHEPQLGRLAGVLLHGDPQRALPLKKAGACLLAFEGRVQPGGARLRSFLPPRVLRRLSGKRERV
jgi:phosphohistidine phosphatase